MLRVNAYLIMSLVITGLMLSACNAPNRPATSDDEVNGSLTSMSELNVPKSFDWKTFRDVEVTLTAEEKGMMQVVSKGIVYHRAYLNEDNSYKFNLTVPNYVNDVKVLFRGQEVSFELSNGKLTHHFEATTNMGGASGKMASAR